MSPLVDRLVQLRRYVEHLHTLAPRVSSASELEADLSLQNDVLHSLQVVAQNVADIAGELNTRRGRRFSSYREAITNLEALPEFPPEVVERLALLPGFRNVVVHEYLSLDFERVVAAVHDLGPVEEFVRIVARIESAA